MAIERREQVFVSSTYLDLAEERQEVIQTLLEADCIPSGMELFPASNDDRWTLIQRIIDDCDYYLLVIGGRYGSIDDQTQLSYTEMEYDYADSIGKPVLAFLHGSPGEIAADKTELDPGAREKLADFRAKVGERMVKYWDSPSSLGGQVAKSLIQVRKTNPAEGWIRARFALTPEVERELAELRAKVAELTTAAVEHRSAGGLRIDNLEQDDDEVRAGATLLYYDAADVEAENLGYQSRRTVNTRLTTTWNKLFEAVAPDLLDEASDESMRTSLNNLLASLARERLPMKMKLTSGEEVTAALIASAAVQSETFNDVKVQFFALGWIEKSERRRAVSDTTTYWTLTGEGRDRLMRSRAKRRTAAPDDSPADLEEVTEP